MYIKGFRVAGNRTAVDRGKGFSTNQQTYTQILSTFEMLYFLIRLHSEQCKYFA